MRETQTTRARTPLQIFVLLLYFLFPNYTQNSVFFNNTPHAYKYTKIERHVLFRLVKEESELAASRTPTRSTMRRSTSTKTTKTGSHRDSFHSGTFRNKPVPVGQKGIELQAHINSTLGNNGSLRDAVKLPKGEDELEWIAVNVVDFFNALVFLYDMVNTEHCTEKTCPTMCAGPKFEYRWMDGEEVVKPMECSAPVYCGYLFRWVEKQVDDEKIFPKKQGDAFPSDFKKRVKKIAARLFRVYAHLYHSHFKIICALQAEKHLNTIFLSISCILQ